MGLFLACAWAYHDLRKEINGDHEPSIINNFIDGTYTFLIGGTNTYVHKQTIRTYETQTADVIGPTLLLPLGKYGRVSIGPFSLNNPERARVCAELTSAPPVGAVLELTLNGTPVASVVPTGSGTFEDTSNSMSYVRGDTIGVRLVVDGVVSQQAALTWNDDV